MKDFTARLAGLAMLSLAAVPLAAGATAAQAAPNAIQVRDLDLNTKQGLATFQARAEAVTHNMCRTAPASGYRVQNEGVCRTAVKAEIADKLARAQQAQLSQTQTLAAR